MEPKIAEKAWEPKLENAILKKWEEQKLYDFLDKFKLKLKKKCKQHFE